MRAWKVRFADRLATTFLRWSQFWNDVSVAELTGRTREEVKAERERGAQDDGSI